MRFLWPQVFVDFGQGADQPVGAGGGVLREQGHVAVAVGDADGGAAGGFGGDESRYKLLYPGDDVVDVLGMDFYDTDNTRLAKDKWAGELVQDLAMLSRMAAARGKIAALAEFGREGYKMLKPDGNTDPNWYTDVLEAIKANPDAAKVAYMMTWANFGGSPVFSAFTPWPGHEMADNFREFVKQMTMTRNAERDITVDVTIEHGTTDDGDIKTTTHTVTIPKGQNSATFTIDAVADGKQEGDEHYYRNRD